MSKVPTDFRRVTMMVNHMEPALTIYRDILGMDVYYDQEIGALTSTSAVPISQGINEAFSTGSHDQ